MPYRNVANAGKTNCQHVDIKPSIKYDLCLGLMLSM